MNTRLTQRTVAVAMLAAAFGTGTAAVAQLNSGDPQVLSTGQTVTPLVPRGSSFQPLNPGLADNPEFTAGQAVQTAISPDKKTLVILTSGYNTQSNPSTGAADPADSNEYVFVFDISRPAAVQKQVILVPNTYNGIAFNRAGTELFVSGGVSDNVHAYSQVAGAWTEEAGSPIALGHLAKAVPSINQFGGLGIAIMPEASGVATTLDGTKLVVTNYENDSISVLTKIKGVWTVANELDLRPGVTNPSRIGDPGGSFPFWVVIKGNTTAYISSIRDREIDVVDISGAPVVTERIHVPGQPNKMVLNHDDSRLFVAQDNSDSVAVIDTRLQKVLAEIPVTAPSAFFENKHGYKGANPNNLALSPDEKTLYVTNGGENAVAVVKLVYDYDESRPVGLIPTGFYPNSISVAGDGKTLYIVNGKSATGPNPQYETASANQYTWQLTKAGFQTVPTPEVHELEALTIQVLENDHFYPQRDREQQHVMEELHEKIQHVIYIIKENRTYDQILGDLEQGNGDPSLTMYGAATTPNLHALASKFVDFDNFYDTSDVSGDGWPWSTSARTTDVIEKEIPVNYGNHGGLSNDSEGTNRNLNVAIGPIPKRAQADPVLVVTGPHFTPDLNLLPGTGNVAAPDADGDDDDARGEGYIWNSALKAGLTVRDYGMFNDIVRYIAPPSLGGIPPLTDPANLKPPVQVAYSTNPALTPFTDPYFRGFDNNFPDYFRFTEWNREFKNYVAKGDLPNLTLLRLMHDHMGNFSTAINGVNTPELQVADNDYAVGLVAEAVAASPFKDNTLIFVIEDDAQDGADHMDAHRSTAFIIGPYVRRGFVDSKRYNTVNFIRTIEDVLGIPHLNLNDAHAEPMSTAFDLHKKEWKFTAVPSQLLAGTTLPITFPAKTAVLQPLHGADWWSKQTVGMNFSVEDKVDTPKFNRILWTGTMGDLPYPSLRSGVDLSQNRAALLEQWKRTRQMPATTQVSPEQLPEPHAKAGGAE